MVGKETTVTVTVDINLLLDVFQRRQPHYAASARILAMVTDGSIQGVFPAHGFTTLIISSESMRRSQMRNLPWMTCSAISR
jgi:hypothetical protein